MKKYKLLLGLLVLTSITSCANIKNSDNTSNEHSSNTSETFSYSDAIISDDDSSIFDDKPSKYYTINLNLVTKTYNPGEIIEFNNESTNYIVLDRVGRIVYTVANAKCGYGNKDKFASILKYQDVATSSLVDNGFKIPSNCKGYEVNFEGYGKFVYEVTNEDIYISDFETDGYSDAIIKWNSFNNSYIDDSFGVVVDEIYNKDLVVSNETAFRLSSIYDTTTSNGLITYKVYAPYDDTYTLSSYDTINIEVYNFNKSLLTSNEVKVTLNLKKDEIIYISVAAFGWFNLSLTQEKHSVELPYEINSSVDTSKYATTSSSSASPLKSASLNYTKRDDGKGLYVNCNNPEKLSTTDMNKCLTRQEVTDKDVFFTFEHNNASANYYYGYRVTNTGESDVYITVKNLGFQTKGAGTWLGEDEWIKFYNTKFNFDTSSFTTSQKNNFDAYFGLGGNYESENRIAITYRVPANEYIYVMGGTTKDSYNNINVFDSADVLVNRSLGGCGNGAVLFSVTNGKAEGSFLVYTDDDAKTINNTDYVKGDKQQGYVAGNYGSQYVGDEACHGVVDANLVWEFNDNTYSQFLPVTYNNPYYADTSVTKGTAHTLIQNIIGYENKDVESWHTHINGNSHKDAVGTDMTVYNTINSKGEKIIIDQEHYDGKGNQSNIGNWMVDYIETLTFVNQGDNDRNITYTMTFNGTILTMIRNMDGLISDTYTPTYSIMLGKTSYGDAIDQRFKYFVTIPAHSIVQFAVNYNLLANSSGNIAHQIFLG